MSVLVACSLAERTLAVLCQTSQTIDLTPLCSERSMKITEPIQSNGVLNNMQEKNGVERTRKGYDHDNNIHVPEQNFALPFEPYQMKYAELFLRCV